MSNTSESGSTRATPAKPIGWDVSVFRRQRFVPLRAVQVIAAVVAVPYLCNVVSVVSRVRKNRADNGGKIKLSGGDIARIFGIDAALLMGGLFAYTFLTARGGLKIVPRFA